MSLAELGAVQVVAQVPGLAPVLELELVRVLELVLVMVETHRSQLLPDVHHCGPARQAVA